MCHVANGYIVLIWRDIRRAGAAFGKYKFRYDLYEFKYNNFSGIYIKIFSYVEYIFKFLY